MGKAIWTWLHLNDEGLDEADLGLIAEARRLAGEIGNGTVTVLAAGEDTEDLLGRLAEYGAQHVIHLRSPQLERFKTEVFARVLGTLLETDPPAALLFAHRPQTVEMAARVGAALDCPVITRAVDAHGGGDGAIRAVRPIANGYLFETVETLGSGPVLMTFLPDVLPDSKPKDTAPLAVEGRDLEVDAGSSATQTVEIIEADPETLAIEEADIVVAAGRGAGKDASFDVIQRLAQAIGGSVGGTRPVIDDHLLPFERQIGQTGKTVTPRLIINCGISGANEYTAGIEKSQLVIAVNTDPRARIFRFADLGIVGDLHQVLPLLAERIEKAMTTLGMD